MDEQPEKRDQQNARKPYEPPSVLRFPLPSLIRGSSGGQVDTVGKTTTSMP